MEKQQEKVIEEILTRGVNEVIDCENLKKRLLSDEKLRIKFGTDPTSPNIHLGRAVPLLKLRDLQELGHQIVFLIGDFTGVIGDTSDKESERPMLEREVVEKNMETYFEQAGKILDMSKVEVVKNSDWLGKLTYNEISEQADIFSLAEFIARDNIKKRLEKGTRISLRELLYPLMQGYDSVVLKADLELGGTDQRFNLLAGREMQKKYKQKPQDVMMTDLIEGLDGRKMSSSWGNTINLTDDANSMFGKVMSMGDELIGKYFVHCTRIPMEDVAQIEKEMKEEILNPRDAKLRLAGEITAIYHGEELARSAREYFINTFSKKEIPTEIAEFEVSEEMKLSELVVKSENASSMGDARRKIEQGGVSVDDEKLLDPQILVTKEFDGKVLKIGKLGFVKIIFKK
ncbi:MAG: Tyrosine-tRNA ligase [Candidatus Moranbacteria bacterium GW2011_GWC2_37_73]|nr:MAG: tyrosyl-tRNA synthetase, tyrosyl-tRNA synthetase [Parcubacteria group bacterium GW2011_GWC1_36_108]KKQ00644.1 MAG: Tyrosine-tRNA ligase [Candidatus Moranbacteria bacterium GW2011_GWD1_36_198]KKQ01932.1 MAG: Tyrosine-tRNA ligase [Candidatus Moranbacteria bacterium GW2011_GWD2_36_198]KKQ39485.1 MAG: Tyrosine-tRNA ligase [Candidatus Moranbacteria bacterium GW2011_GWC2_37_73]HAR99796.1 tyrosine--tRNA ligase [Candidatus Moranbacteria bacterium]